MNYSFYATELYLVTHNYFLTELQLYASISSSHTCKCTAFFSVTYIFNYKPPKNMICHLCHCQIQYSYWMTKQDV